jgi:hypothetical protein
VLNNFHASYSQQRHKIEPAKFTWSDEDVSFEVLLRRYLNDLLRLMAVEAFHPLIRLSFAIEFDHQPQVANGLAYWLCNHVETPVCLRKRLVTLRHSH